MNKKIIIVLIVAFALIGCGNSKDIKKFNETEIDLEGTAIEIADSINVDDKDFEKKAEAIVAQATSEKEYTLEDAMNIVEEEFKDLLSKNPEFYMYQEASYDENGEKYYEGSLDKRHIRVYANGKIYNAIGEWKANT